METFYAYMVDQVIPKSPAEKAGLKPGDLILGFSTNGTDKETVGQYDFRPGDFLQEVRVAALGTDVWLEVMQYIPGDTHEEVDYRSTQLKIFLGIKAGARRQAQLGIVPIFVQGIGYVEESSPAAKAGVRAGGFIRQVNGEPVANLTPVGANRLVEEAAKAGKKLELLLGYGMMFMNNANGEPARRFKSQLVVLDLPLSKSTD